MIEAAEMYEKAIEANGATTSLEIALGGVYVHFSTVVSRRIVSTQFDINCLGSQ